MKININKKLTIFLVIFLAVFGIFNHTFNNITTVRAIELNIGQAAQDAEVPGTSAYNPSDPGSGFGIFVSKLLTITMTVGALLVFLNLLWGGIGWITSGGDKGKLETARNRMTHSVIGLIVLSSVVAIFMMIQGFLGLEIFKFSSSSSTTETIPYETGHGHELE